VKQGLTITPKTGENEPPAGPPGAIREQGDREPRDAKQPAEPGKRWICRRYPGDGQQPLPSRRRPNRPGVRGFNGVQTGNQITRIAMLSPQRAGCVPQGNLKGLGRWVVHRCQNNRPYLAFVPSPWSAPLRPPTPPALRVPSPPPAGAGAVMAISGGTLFPGGGADAGFPKDREESASEKLVLPRDLPVQ
jgi:hypothetical protein